MSLLSTTISSISDLPSEIMDQTQQRLDNLTKPPGSLGVLEAIARQVAGITGNPRPQVAKKTIILMAGDHGVVAEGVSAFPQEVTPQMVMNFINSGAGINVLARHAGADLVLVDIGVAADLPDHPMLCKQKVAYGTKNMARGPAMTREEAIQALEVGINIAKAEVAKGVGLLGTGEMGIGNTTPSAAIIAVCGGYPVAEVVGRGTGIDDEGLARKIKTIEQAIAVNKPDPQDALDVLTKVGGLEIAGLAGVILGAAASRVPVIIDGFISGAAAVIAQGLQPKARQYMIGSHLSVEPGHRLTLEVAGLKPVLMMEMRLGEGTGAALGMTVVDAALKILNGMATFDEAGVSGAL